MIAGKKKHLGLFKTAKDGFVNVDCELYLDDNLCMHKQRINSSKA